MYRMPSEMILWVGLWVGILSVLLVVNIGLWVTRRATYAVWVMHLLSLALGIVCAHRVYQALSSGQIKSLRTDTLLTSLEAAVVLLGGALALYFALPIGRERSKRMGGLNLAPVLQLVEDLVYICDSTGAVMMCNHPEMEQRLFSGSCGSLSELLARLEGGSANPDADQALILGQGLGPMPPTEVSVPGHGHYLMTVSPVAAKAGGPVATVVTLHDVSDEYALSQIIAERNRELQAANKKLREYVGVAAHLEAERERLRLLNHLHEQLIEEIQGIVTDLKPLMSSDREDLPALRAAAEVFGDRLRGIYRDVRLKVSEIKPPDKGVES